MVKLHCARCGRDKPVRDFPLQKGASELLRHGRSSYCLECRREYSREYRRKRYARDPEFREKTKATNRAYSASDAGRAAKRRARKRAAEQARLAEQLDREERERRRAAAAERAG